MLIGELLIRKHLPATPQASQLVFSINPEISKLADSIFVITYPIGAA